MKKILRSLKFFVLLIVIMLTGINTSTIEKNIENTNLNKTVNLSTMAIKIEENIYESLYTPLNTISGSLTGYVYNCPLCTGRLACMSSLDLSNGTTTFNDVEYGEVHIVASSKDLPCGSVVSFESNRISDTIVNAIVLDRGVIGSDLDLLVGSLEDAINNVGRSNITYNVLRNGWNKSE